MSDSEQAKALRLELAAVEAQDALEKVRARVHKAGPNLPPKLAQEWKDAQNAVVEARRAHREHGVAAGLRPAPEVAAPETIQGSVSVNGGN